MKKREPLSNDPRDIAHAAGWNACLDALAAVQAPGALQPMSEHNARFAIDGAIQYGREDRNKPPSDDHWLMEYWLIGQQLRELGKTGWDSRTPLDPAERIVVAPSAPVAREVPEGWKMVPEEPTGDMFLAAAKIDNAAFAGGSSHGADDEQIWQAMYAAAPNPPLPGEAT